MSISIERIAALERVNYEASLAAAAVTPGLEMVVRDDVIITRSQIFPTPDANHACLLRATPNRADDLITEIINYFQSKELPVTVFISPACAPPDLAKRLLARGFVEQDKEAWMTLDELSPAKIPPPTPKAPVKRITQADALTFAQVFMTAFDMPLDMAPVMAGLLAPSVGLPGVYHYLGFLEDKPVGTLSLICHKNVGVFGSAGVIPDRRGRLVISNLMIEAGGDALRHGVDMVLLQTSAGFMLERLLSMYGFKKIFTRTSYTLP